MKKQFTVIKSNPTPEMEWLSDGLTARNTYKWWAAILDIKLDSVLLSLDIPIYIAHGSADTASPVESSDRLNQLFTDFQKINLTYKRYEGLGHDWRDQYGTSHPEVISQALTWLVNRVK